ncbi:VanZ family protein [Geitlerinema sp. PCC 9228]|jgi:VanZ family protein|uniref:VanZ family protein n=1 Tax=Geitlerinema sp. PCC 9228 TaxID=111611 RepID=UPI0008F9B010|nr:VanZ family protein [Geitlerinema sp. PCC 9228]
MKKSAIVRRKWIVTSSVYLLVLLGIFMAANLGWLPTALLSKIPRYDLWGHFLLYGAAAYLIHRAFGKRMLRVGRFSLSLGISILIGLMVAEEFFQMALPRRTASLVDLAAGCFGILVFYGWGESRDRVARKKLDIKKSPRVK